MIFDTAHEVLGSPSKNPKYLNIYQVMKISMENRQVTDDMDIYRCVFSLRIYLLRLTSVHDVLFFISLQIPNCFRLRHERTIPQDRVCIK